MPKSIVSEPLTYEKFVISKKIGCGERDGVTILVEKLFRSSKFGVFLENRESLARFSENSFIVLWIWIDSKTGKRPTNKTKKQ